MACGQILDAECGAGSFNIDVVPHAPTRILWMGKGARYSGHGYYCDILLDAEMPKDQGTVYTPSPSSSEPGGGVVTPGELWVVERALCALEGGNMLGREAWHTPWTKWNM